MPGEDGPRGMMGDPGCNGTKVHILLYYLTNKKKPLTLLIQVEFQELQIAFDFTFMWSKIKVCKRDLLQTWKMWNFSCFTKIDQNLWSQFNSLLCTSVGLLSWNHWLNLIKDILCEEINRVQILPHPVLYGVST